MLARRCPSSPPSVCLCRLLRPSVSLMRSSRSPASVCLAISFFLSLSLCVCVSLCHCLSSVYIHQQQQQLLLLDAEVTCVSGLACGFEHGVTLFQLSSDSAAGVSHLSQRRLRGRASNGRFVHLQPRALGSRPSGAAAQRPAVPPAACGHPQHCCCCCWRQQ